MDTTDHQFIRQLEAQVAEQAAQLFEVNSKLKRTSDELERIIAEQRQTAEALQESESKYRLLTENSSDVVWRLDSEYRFTYISPAVRAYPGGEGYGDQGILAQVELRYRVKQLSPYLFYDLGHVRINKHDGGSDNHRRIDGTGIGLRADYKNLSSDIAVAWRTRGGEPLSDSKDRDPRLWVTVGYKF
jgi:PAS domain-containing protein